MITQDVLKIECQRGVLLSSEGAKEKITPFQDRKILRSLNGAILTENNPDKEKYVWNIECFDDPDIRFLKRGEIFKLYPTTRFFEYCSSKKTDLCQNCLKRSVNAYKNGSKIDCSVEENSIITSEIPDYISYRPVLDVVLSDFTCQNVNGKNNWSFIFEET